MMKRSLVPVLVLLLVGLSTAAVNKGDPVGAPFTGFAGFMEVQQQYNSNMFYWLFPSMDGNPNAPLILWLEGGPGIPCAFSIFGGPGRYRLEYSQPYNFSSDLVMLNNTNTFNQHNHMLFVDNPIGVGFSFTDNDEGYPADENDVAATLATFLMNFYKSYPQFLPCDFFVMGESYGGKYAPALAALLSRERNNYPILWKNLKGVAIGAGLFDPAIQASTWASFGVNVGIMDAVAANKWNEQTVKPLIQLIEEGNYVEASELYYGTIIDLTLRYNASLYNYMQSGAIVQNDWISSFAGGAPFLNTTAHRQAINVYPYSMPPYMAAPGFFIRFSSDIAKSITSEVAVVVEDIPMLLYNGQLDWFLNAPGQLKWLQRLNWSGQAGFNQSTSKPVQYNMTGYPVPLTVAWARQYRTLTFAVLSNSGHFATLDAPTNLYGLVSLWMESLSQ